MYDEFGTIVCLDSGSGYVIDDDFFLYSFWVSSFIMVGLLSSLLLWQNYCIVKLCGRNGDSGGGFLLQHFYIIYMVFNFFFQLFPILLLFFTITTTTTITAFWRERERSRKNH